MCAEAEEEEGGGEDEEEEEPAPPEVKVESTPFDVRFPGKSSLPTGLRA